MSTNNNLDLDSSEDIKSISTTITTLQNCLNQLQSALSSTDKTEKDFKLIIDNIKWRSHDLYKSSNDLSYKIQKEIVSKCRHDYEPDYSYYDPCRTTKVCKNCGDIW